MARQTRAERRARRLAQGEPAIAGAGAGDGRSPEPSPRPATERRWTGGWIGSFIRECIGELRKVEWPGQNQVVQGTVVVIVACVIIGTYLYVCDQVFGKLVSKVLLGQ